VLFGSPAVFASPPASGLPASGSSDAAYRPARPRLRSYTTPGVTAIWRARMYSRTGSVALDTTPMME
jgi:hypothetical protein